MNSIIAFLRLTPLDHRRPTQRHNSSASNAGARITTTGDRTRPWDSRRQRAATSLTHRPRLICVPTGGMAARLRYGGSIQMERSPGKAAAALSATLWPVKSWACILWLKEFGRYVSSIWSWAISTVQTQARCVRHVSQPVHLKTVKDVMSLKCQGCNESVPCAVTARKAGGTWAVRRPTTPVPRAIRAVTAQRAVPTTFAN